MHHFSLKAYLHETPYPMQARSQGKHWGNEIQYIKRLPSKKLYQLNYVI